VTSRRSPLADGPTPWRPRNGDALDGEIVGVLPPEGEGRPWKAVPAYFPPRVGLPGVRGRRRLRGAVLALGAASTP